MRFLNFITTALIAVTGVAGAPVPAEDATLAARAELEPETRGGQVYISTLRLAATGRPKLTVNRARGS
jgi:hypothetical protein